MSIIIDKRRGDTLGIQRRATACEYLAAQGTGYWVGASSRPAVTSQPYTVLDALRGRTRRVEAALGLSVDVRGQ